MLAPVRHPVPLPAHLLQCHFNHTHRHTHCSTDIGTTADRCTDPTPQPWAGQGWRCSNAGPRIECRWYTEIVEVDCRHGGRPTHTRSTPVQTGARARAHVVSKPVPIVLATNVFNVTCNDASRTHSSVDRDLPEGLRANTASHC